MAAEDSPATPPAEPMLVITRVFDAPPSVVFKAWTRPEHFVRWWGPKGFTVPFCTIDLRPGGVMHFHTLIEALVSNSPLLAWLNPLLGPRGTSALNGGDQS